MAIFDEFGGMEDSLEREEVHLECLSKLKEFVIWNWGRYFADNVEKLFAVKLILVKYGLEAPLG